MILEEHLYCPKCGYDLHGIPEVRCPECGFRYDAAALRSMAASADWLRLAAARNVILRATMAGAMTVPVTMDRIGFPDWAVLGGFAAAWAAAFMTWVVVTDAYRGVGSIPNLFTLFLGVSVSVFVLLKVAAVLILAGSVILLALAWFVRLRNWESLSPVGNVQSSAVRRSLTRYSVAATSVLVVVSVLVLVALVV